MIAVKNNELWDNEYTDDVLLIIFYNYTYTSVLETIRRTFEHIGCNVIITDNINIKYNIS